MADQLDTFHRGYQHSVDRISRFPNTSEFCLAGANDIERLQTAVRAVLEGFPASDRNIRGAAILDLTGTVKLATEAKLAGTNLSFHGYIREAIREGRVVSDIHFAEPQVGLAPTIAYLAPVFGPDHKMIGLAALWVRAEALWNVIKKSNSFLVLMNPVCAFESPPLEEFVCAEQGTGYQFSL